MGCDKERMNPSRLSEIMERLEEDIHEIKDALITLVDHIEGQKRRDHIH